MKISKTGMMLSLFIFLFVIPFINAGELQIFSDSFIYSDAFTLHGWSYSNGGCGVFPEVATPIESPIWGSNAFGINASPSICAFSYFAKIEEDIVPENIGGLVVITYSFNIVADSTKQNTVFEVQALTSNSSSSGIVFNHYEGGSNFTSEMSGAVTGENCLHTDMIAEGEELLPFIGNGRIEIDLGEGEYNWYINGDIGGCSHKSTDMSSFKTIVIRRGVDGSENQTSYVDNIIVSYSNSTLSLVVGNLPLGVPCEEDSDCISNNCEYGICSKNVGLENCNIDADCISGICLNGKCTKPSTWQLAEESKNQWFGNDTKTNNMISLFISFGVALVIIFYGGRKAIIGGVVAYYGLSFFFAIVGWLSVFILIGDVIAGLLIFVFAVMLGGGSE